MTKSLKSKKPVTSKLTAQELLGKVKEYAFLFCNVFNDIKLKSRGRTIHLAEGNGGMTGRVQLDMGYKWVDNQYVDENTKVFTQLVGHGLPGESNGTLMVSITPQVGFSIKSSVLADFHEVDYFIIKGIPHDRTTEN